jgi:hypothetical protein
MHPRTRNAWTSPRKRSQSWSPRIRQGTSNQWNRIKVFFTLWRVLPMGIQPYRVGVIIAICDAAPVRRMASRPFPRTSHALFIGTQAWKVRRGGKVQVTFEQDRCPVSCYKGFSSPTPAIDEPSIQINDHGICWTFSVDGLWLSRIIISFYSTPAPGSFLLLHPACCLSLRFRHSRGYWRV